ncbi:hypothetical protein [uncultured Brachyspira sp.]|uniref:hypothetical protein n=1 Tax=uncultured Brachyspira sp. TaxID=221953 RepID=UPI002589A97A|nr:hypothetical protein [uncultured Brachyspira sp.]
MDNNIQKIIDFFDDERVKVRYQDKDLILMASLDWIADDVKKVPQAKDELDVLWIYDTYFIYKLVGGNLATIRDQLLAVPIGFKPYNDKIIIGGDVLFRFDGFVIANCKISAAFYLPNTKITEYEIPDEDENVDEI